MDGKSKFAKVTDNQRCCFHSVLSIHQNEGCVVDTLVGLLVTNHNLGGCVAAACRLHGWLVGLLVTNQEGTLVGLLVTNHDLGGGCAAAACRLHGWLVDIFSVVYLSYVATKG